ncbi:MAG: tetratricopeptide repeat protein [Sphaerochaetaceae bacterium]|nr:tetratricopeptide repeat protein [Sphaerochaetaceae bacterium]
MKKDLKDIKFITLPGDRKIGTTVLSAKIPLPVEFSEGQDPNDIDFNSIVAGLIKVVAWTPENNNYKYYKDVLLELQPEVVKELNIAAISKSGKKEYEFAEELMLAVNHLSEAPESYVNLAVLYAQMTVDMHKSKDDIKADMYDDKILEILTQCINRHPKYAAAYSEISAFHMRHGNVEDARDALAKYVSLETDLKKKATAQGTLDSINKMLSSKDQIMYAYDKMMMGCADEAVDVINKYLAANEGCWEAFFIRGWAKRTLEDFKGAQIDLLESLRIDGKNAEVYNELSICARESGDVELAKSYLQIAVDLDPTDVIYLTNLAFLHLADEEFEEARELMEKSRTIDPEDPQLKYLMEEYEKHTGDKIGEVISEEVYTDEDFDELHRQEKEQNITHKEI